MNKFARMMLRDNRNPYGSRGGYVRDYEHEDMRRRDYNDDYGSMRDRSDYVRRDMRDMRDYANYYDSRRDYGDYRRRDYGEPEMFTHKDIETWKSMMKNEDGTRGEHFRKEQVQHACEKAGIDCEEFGDDIFSLAMNMMYSDYCKVAMKYGVDAPEFYADLAKAFLRDKDFDGKPEEKLYLYYKAIVEKDD